MQKTEKLKEMFKSDLPPRASSVYMYLYQRSYNKDFCFPSITTISSDTKLSRSTVKRALSDLEKQNFIRRVPRHRENGGQSSNLYMLVFENDTPKTQSLCPYGEPGRGS